MTHPFRTHTCADLRSEHIGQNVKLSGWIHRKRDHGGVLFIDLRDTYGVTQCVVDEGSPLLAEIEKFRPESVITVEGEVRVRPGETQNKNMPTGDIELYISAVELQGAADVIPFQVAEDDGAGEDIRLKYRYLDLRREKMQKNIRLRNAVIFSLRERMHGNGFQEFQTPILTASSPEGARDYLVPSRLHPGKFYALPQAPQQFKQLLINISKSPHVSVMKMAAPTAWLNFTNWIWSFHSLHKKRFLSWLNLLLVVFLKNLMTSQGRQRLFPPRHSNILNIKTRCSNTVLISQTCVTRLRLLT